MVNFKEDADLNKLNHSCAHLLAQAVKHLYPEAKFWVGPVVEEGFYYDIDLGDVSLTEEDLEKIEKEMKKCSKDAKNIVRHEISKEEALEQFKDDPYKIDLISRMDENDTVISCYSQGDFTDLCRGPHVDNTKELKNFKLLKVSGAYWKGDAKNKMLQRIYGVCFENEDDLNNYLKELEEAKSRDHRKIGKDLDLFMAHDLVGKGMPLWLPNGALKGIERVRTFCQNDSHIFCTLEQVESEFKGVVDLILECYKELGIKNYRFELSLRDPEDKVKYHHDDEMWNKAEDMLRQVLNDLKIDYVEKIGEAAFYGPKLDVQVKPAVGNEITLSTCQLDFCLPAKFDLTYVDADGSHKTPVVLHRAVFGSLDRFIAYYLEETKGNLPTWLAPTQVIVMPVNSEFQGEYAKEIYELLRDNDIRVELDDRNEKLGYRLRESQVKKIPYTLILGDNEKDNNQISYRLFGSQETTTLDKDEFVKQLKEEISKRLLRK